MPALSDFADSIAIVVSSCDAFFDAWKPFASFFERFWHDCPFEAFLITNKLKVRSRRLHQIQIGKDLGWSNNLIAALSRIHHPYLLYFQEDYFLTSPVLQDQLAADCNYVLSSNADSLCFRARSQPDSGFRKLNERFGLVPLDSDGRTRCQVTLWKKSSLQSILRRDETAWDFEARGSARTREMQILSYIQRENTPVPYLMSAISRGLWMPEAITLCREHKVAIEPFFRPLYSAKPWLRRWRRALGRARLRRNLTTQSNQPIDLG